MEEELLRIKRQALESISGASDFKEVGDIKVKFLGKQGLLTSILRGMRDVPAEERPKVGAIVNEVRNVIEKEIEIKENQFAQEELSKKLENEKVDITEPSKMMKKGARHPITALINRIIDACVEMGFSVVQGPEVESDYYNFEALNLPKNHPARDMQDSFYITENILLRTQTSAVQSRELEKKILPMKIIVPGKTYRNDSDSTHSPVFHQIEGLVVDENVSMADLKSMLSQLMKKLFGESSKVRFRPSYFPFTEPSIEVDVTCPNCLGEGCKTCKGTGFMEILGAGVVHPNVLEKAGIDSKKYQGFAFGIGVDRSAMIFNGITDLRTMYRNDVRFLNQLR